MMMRSRTSFTTLQQRAHYPRIINNIIIINIQKTIEMYQGHLNVKDKLIETIRVLLGPRERYTVNEVKDKIGELKFMNL